MTAEPKIRNFGTIIDDTENNRLILNYERAAFKDEEAYDFHSLVWEIKDEEEWVKHIVISDKVFDTDPIYQRWVAELQYFDPFLGQAILKIGEGDAPRNEDQKIIYSWRKWDLNNNKQIAMLQVCNDPFETYDSENN